MGAAAETNLDELTKPFLEVTRGIEAISGGLQGMSASLESDTPSYDPADYEKWIEQMSGGADQVVGSAEGVVDSVAAIGSDPVAFIGYILQTAASGAIQSGVDAAMGALSKLLLLKHIPGNGLEEYAAAFGIHDLRAAAAWNRNGSGNVEMIVRYEFEIPLFGGLRFAVVQRTMTRGWGLGV